MLVCSVSIRPQRHVVAAAVEETAEALDNPTLGAIFATLTDDPGAASDHLDGFVGQMTVEAASAASVVDAGSLRSAAVVEETNAGAIFWSPSTYAVTVAETATGASIQDAVIIVPGIFAAAIAETATATDLQDAIAVVVYSAMLDGAFVDPRPPATVIGTDMLDSGPITVFEP